jgi:hypothetical protein
MKRFLTLVVCAVIAAAFVQPANAQSADAVVTVNVQSTLQVTNLPGIQTLSFGSVLPDGTYDVPFASGVDFEISGASSVPVIVSFTAPTQLTGPGQPISFTADLQGSETNDPGSASPVVSGNQRNLNADGNHYLWLGGEIEVGNVLPGTYSATFTVSVAY